mgnify:CR=1 FL=1
MRILLVILITLTSFGSKADIQNVESLSYFKSEDDIKKHYGDIAKQGLLSPDNEYFQAGGDINTFLEALKVYKIKKATLHDIETDEIIEFETPLYLKEITIDGSKFNKGLSITLKELSLFIMRENKVIGTFSLYESNPSSKAHLYIGKSTFSKLDDGSGIFDLVEFYGEDFQLLNNEFEVEVSLIDLNPSKKSWIQGNEFRDGITAAMDSVKGEFLFLINEVIGESAFIIDQFDNEARFNSSSFDGKTIMENIVFSKKPYFTRTRFKGSLDLTASNFIEGVDFRVAKFDKGTEVQLEAFEGDMTQFQIDMSQIELIDLVLTEPVEQLKNKNEREQEELARLNKVYEQLKQSFKIRGLTEEYDALSLIHYREKNKIKKNLFFYMYDFFMAYGYETWRFILFVIFPSIVILSIVYTRNFKEDIREVIRRKDQAGAEQNYDTSTLAHIARTAAISSSILFAIRYKTIWLTEKHSFNKFVMFNYLYGIFLYLLFAMGTRVSSFDIVKSFIGI